MPAIILNINGSERKVDAASGESLLSVLRNRLCLTGTKYGCGEGECGACTVLLQGNGKDAVSAIRSCRIPADSVAGQKIVTIEGLAGNGALHPVQQAFLDEEAFQCGYCTPGMVLSACALLKDIARPTDAEIMERMNNICRCGTYPRILAAVRRAAQTETKGKKP
jgi:aerobic-type carbon monoxide dehydrogenase small subunit (CoxS/CutS family)